MTDDLIIVGQALPRLKEAHPADGFCAHVTWRDGEAAVVNLAPAIFSHRHFICLRDDAALFRALRANEDGTAIEWPGDIALSAEWIERLPEAGMENAEFRAIMERRHLSLEGMAAALEISRRQVADFRASKRIPAHIALAARYIDHKADVGGRMVQAGD